MDVVAGAKELDWYHSLELAPGYVTPGMFDLRDQVDQYRLPARLDGLRALDGGAWDGFWAFEMERRGAEVVALDLDDERELDWPANRRPATYPETLRGAGFALAKEVFGSKVERVNRSIYDALPEDLGTFDLVFCGSVLIHLRDQPRRSPSPLGRRDRPSRPRRWTLSLDESRARISWRLADSIAEQGSLRALWQPRKAMRGVRCWSLAPRASSAAGSPSACWTRAPRWWP
ncbi:MAG: hypothetical protein AABM31_00955 [Actinomycetota bacterium]